MTMPEGLRFLSDPALAGLAGAVLGALVTVLFGWRALRIEQADAYKREFQGAINNLINYNEDYISRVQKIADLREQQMVAGLLNDKKNVYLETADFLASKLGSRVSPSEYRVLANSYAENSDFESAEKSYLSAVKSARSRKLTIPTAVAMRALGIFYFSNNPKKNFKKGRDWFNQSCLTLISTADPYSIFTLALSHENWGLMELSNGFWEDARAQFSHAKKFYSDLPDNYILKAQNLPRTEYTIQLMEEFGRSRLSEILGALQKWEGPKASAQPEATVAVSS